MPTSYPAVDKAIVADHSGSIVLDLPFGLRGGIPVDGVPFFPQALVMATADGHPGRSATPPGCRCPPRTPSTTTRSTRT